MGPSLRFLMGIEMHTVPDMKSKSCKPYVEIVNVRDDNVQFNAKKGFKLKTYHRTRQGAGDVDGHPKNQSNYENSGSFAQFDNEFKLDSQSMPQHRNTQVVYRASSSGKGNNRNSKDRPSLFAFDSDNNEENENSKRRSNSMGEEGILRFINF